MWRTTRTTLFPYTTLFRSDDRQIGAVDDPLLRRRDDLAPGHRHRDPAEPVDRVGEHLGLLHPHLEAAQDRKSTRLNSSHSQISYAVFCLKKKNKLISSS